MKNKIIVLFSGGIDSTVCLAKAVKEVGKENVLALSIDYGQNNIRELNAVNDICKYYDVKNEVIDLSNVFKYSSSSLIKSSNHKIPHETYDKQYLKLGPKDDVSTNVSFRNGVFFSVCASYAISKKYDTIYNGIHREDGVAYELYPDCSSEFSDYMAKAIYKGSNGKVNLISPLVEMRKKEIIALGKELEIPFEKTWTCYEDDELPCGKCTACMDRIKGFEENGLKDVVKYKG